jgi:hypothetical protein
MSDRLITVATYQDAVAASLAKNFLEGQGIPAILLDETTIATDWLLSSAIGGVKLQVAQSHAEQAALLLRKNHEEDEDDAPVTPSAIASREIAEDLQAESDDRRPVNQLADRLFRVTILGLIFWPLQLYTLWLLLQFMCETERVSPDRSWKVWFCVLMTPLILLMLLLAVTCTAPGLFRLP